MVLGGTTDGGGSPDSRAREFQAARRQGRCLREISLHQERININTDVITQAEAKSQTISTPTGHKGAHNRQAPSSPPRPFHFTKSSIYLLLACFAGWCLLGGRTQLQFSVPMVPMFGP